MFDFDLNLTVVTPHNVTIIGFGIEFRVGFQMKEGARTAKNTEVTNRWFVTVENFMWSLHLSFVDQNTILNITHRVDRLGPKEDWKFRVA